MNKRLIDAFVAVVVERMKIYCEDNGIALADFDYDLDEFELLTVGDVMMALVRFDDTGFDQSAFLKQVTAELKQ